MIATQAKVEPPGSEKVLHQRDGQGTQAHHDPADQAIAPSDRGGRRRVSRGAIGARRKEPST